MKAAHNTPEYLQKNSALHSGANNGFFGKTHCSEAREKIRRAKLGKKWTDARKQELSIILRQVKAGTHPPRYNGGVFKRNGYVFLWQMGYKEKTGKSDNYTFRSHVVIENILKKSLPVKAVVHHINKIRSDDRPENLMAFAKQGFHTNFHHGKEPKPRELLFDGRKFHAI